MSMIKNTFPELMELKNLKNTITERNSEIDKNLGLLESGISNFSNLNLSITDEKINELVLIELNKTNILSEIENHNKESIKLLKEIKFFSSNGSYLTGFFNSSFSSKDKSKWDIIEKNFNLIYNHKNGKLKKIQDFFIGIEKEKFSQIQEKISLEEELFIRSFVMKSYLNNLRQLIMPIYEISDEIFVNFKKERIKELKLEEEKGLIDNSEEINLLRSQINDSELNFLIRKEKESTEKEINNKASDIASLNTSINNRSIIFGTLETARYFSSFVGHKLNSTTLKRIGAFGLESSSYIARIFPLISTVVEAGTQISNNKVVYDYEKKLKILRIIENVKKSLLILEQRIVDYYLNNILRRLQESLISKQRDSLTLVIETRRRNSFLSDSLILDNEIEKVRKDYHQKLEIVKDQVSERYKLRIKEKDKDISLKKEELEEKEDHIKELDDLIFDLNLQSEKKKSEFEKTRREQLKEIKKLERSIDCLNKDCENARIILKEKEESLISREKIINDIIRKGENSDFRIAFEQEIKKSKEAQKTIEILLARENFLNENNEKLKSENKSSYEIFQSEKDELELIRELLLKKKKNLEEENDKLKKERKKLEEKIKEKNDLLSKKEKDIILFIATKEELTRSFDFEIEKSIRYREEINSLKFNNSNLRKKNNEDRKNYLEITKKLANEHNKNLEKLIKIIKESEKEILRGKKEIEDIKKENLSIIVSKIPFIDYELKKKIDKRINSFSFINKSLFLSISVFFFFNLLNKLKEIIFPDKTSKILRKQLEEINYLRNNRLQK